MFQTERLSDILETFFQKHGYDRKILEHKAMFFWSGVVGEKFAPYAQPRSVSEGKMVVVVGDSVRLTELNLQKLKLIDQLNKELGFNIIKDIEFRLGKVPEPRQFSHLDADKITDDINLDDIELEQEVLERIEKTVANVEDGELKDALERFFTSQAKLMKLKG